MLGQITSLEVLLGRIISLKLQGFNGVKLEDSNGVMVVLHVVVIVPF